VLKNHYISEHDEQLRQKSNRTHKRILVVLRPDLAQRMGYVAGEDSFRRPCFRKTLPARQPASSPPIELNNFAAVPPNTFAWSAADTTKHAPLTALVLGTDSSRPRRQSDV
jgi:hypothetical protein